MAIPATTILRTCTTCNYSAKTKDELMLFVKDSSKPQFYFTKSICKKCNNERARSARYGPNHGPYFIARCRICKKKKKTNIEHRQLFVKDKSYKSGWSTSLCKKCNSIRAQDHAKRYPEKFKKRLEKYKIKKHGVSIEDFWKMFEDQKGICKICKSSGKLYIDHDHSCCDKSFSCGKCVRGLICNRCNLMLGMAKDKSDILVSAINYLEGHSLDSRNF